MPILTLCAPNGLCVILRNFIYIYIRGFFLLLLGEAKRSAVFGRMRGKLRGVLSLNKSFDGCLIAHQIFNKFHEWSS